MFDIGFQELVIIFLVALLVFGPERLPEVGRTLGKWLGEIGKGIQNARTQMEKEFHEPVTQNDGEADITHMADKTKSKDGLAAGEEKKEG